MKTILVPTDFSIAALDALNFALAIAPSLEADIKLVHVYSGSFDLNQPFIVRAGMGRLEALQEDLNDFVAASTYGVPGGDVVAEVKLESQVISGFIENELIQLSNAPDIMMLVMGTTGAGDFRGKVFGTISTAISRKAHCPVLLIPKDISFDGIDHIMLASNYESAHPVLIKEVIALAKVFDAVLHFTHVEEPSDKEDFALTEQYILDALLEKNTPAFSFEISTVNSDSVVEGLNDYITKNSVDLIVMASAHPRFWQNILQRSTTKAMALHTHIPILVYHQG